MASAFKDNIKDRVSNATGYGQASADQRRASDAERINNYKLRITAGPSYEKSLQRLVSVNGPSTTVSDEVKVAVRIRDYSGFPKDSPTTSHKYFSHAKHAKDTFSIAFSVTPKDQDIPVKDLTWGIDTGHNPIRKFGLSKSIVQTAFKIVKEFVDPSLQCDASVDEPWVAGPVMAGATTVFRIGGDVGEFQGQWDAPDEDMDEGALGSGTQERQSAGLPEAADKRRKHFSNEANRDKFVLRKGRTYDFDFANGYIDWRTYSLKLPGFSWSPLKYIGDKSHKIRYVLKNPKTGEIWLVVMITLLAGEELKEAMEGRGEGFRDESQSMQQAGRQETDQLQQQGPEQTQHSQQHDQQQSQQVQPQGQQQPHQVQQQTAEPQLQPAAQQGRQQQGPGPDIQLAPQQIAQARAQSASRPIQ